MARQLESNRTRTRGSAIRSLVLLMVICWYGASLFLFRPASVPASRSRRKFRVQLIGPDGSPRVREFECPPDSTILDAAEEAGIEDLPYSCRAGACAACAGKVAKGEVDQAGQAFLDEEQQKHGFCLTCVSYPTSDVVLHTHVENQVV